MTKTGGVAAVFVAMIAAVSCSSTSVQTDYDHQSDFAAFKTFAWYMQSEDDKPPTTGTNQIVDGRIRRAIAGNLADRGFSETAPDTADLLVTYYASLSQQMRMYSTGWGYGWGHGPHWGYGYSYWPGWSYTSVSTWHEGTIIIDIVDRQKKQLVWRGVITRALGKKSSTEEKIDQAMDRVMSEFPPP
jgi:hypothetical protein